MNDFFLKAENSQILNDFFFKADTSQILNDFFFKAENSQILNDFFFKAVNSQILNVFFFKADNSQILIDFCRFCPLYSICLFLSRLVFWQILNLKDFHNLACLEPLSSFLRISNYSHFRSIFILRHVSGLWSCAWLGCSRLVTNEKSTHI